MGKKLLVADDSVTIQKVIKLALSSEHYDILTVSSGSDVLDQIQKSLPDAVLIDASLPDLNAAETKAQINKTNLSKSIKFILMYSAFEKVDEEAVLQAGFHARLIKPFDPSNLRKVVAEVLAMDSSAPPEVPLRPLQMPAAAQPQAAQVQVHSLPPLPPVPTAVQAEQPPAHPLQQLVPQDDLGEVALREPASEDLPPLQDSQPIIADIGLEMSTQSALELESMPVESTGTIDLALPPVERTRFTERHEPVKAPQAEESNDQELENDIRNLTDSTIRMTGIDALSWSVDDSRKMKQGTSSMPLKSSMSPKPPKSPSNSLSPSHQSTLNIEVPSKMLDDGGSQFLNAVPSPASAVPAPVTAPVPGATRRTLVAPTKPAIVAVAPQPHVSVMAAVFNASAGAMADAVKSSGSQSSGQAALPASGTLSRAEIEALIRVDLDAKLEKVIAEMVPRIAEALIKKEIDRILSEP